MKKGTKKKVAKTICKVKKCDREGVINDKGLCRAHYQRLCKWGDVLEDEPLKIRRTKMQLIKAGIKIIVLRDKRI